MIVTLSGTPQRQKGFTLLELLVVLVIIGIILSFASLSFDLGGLERKAEEEVRRMGALITLARQEAILNNDQRALQVFEKRQQFLGLFSDGWKPLTDDEVFRPRHLPDGLHYEVEVLDGGVAMTVQDDDDEVEKSAMIYILSSGEVTPFIMRIIGEDKSEYVLQGDPVGRMKIMSAEEAKESL